MPAKAKTAQRQPPAPAEPSPRDFIIIKNARQNNLKGISLNLPQRRLIVITGVSGSGKSSLAFDTLYAEGQRRYVESLSAYVRQFIGKIDKPLVDYIKGLSPAIAIQQRINTANPRSTVGTSTEIYDYLRLLYARIGRTISPVSGRQVKRHRVGDVVSFINSQPTGTRIMIAAPLVKSPDRTWAAELSVAMQKGFNRLLIRGRVVGIDDMVTFVSGGSTDIIQIERIAADYEAMLPEAKLLIDRVAADADNEENVSRIADSVQTAFFEGHGDCEVSIADGDTLHTHHFNDRYELDGMVFEEPSENLFTFNNPYGACRKCEGFGTVIGIDEEKVIPDRALSVYEGAVACWKGEKMGEWRIDFVKKAAKLDFPVHKPYRDLSAAEKNLLWEGDKNIEGINDFFDFVETQAYKIQYRVMMARYKGRTDCRVCHGARLRPEAEFVKVDGRSIGELVMMPCSSLLEHLMTLKLDDFDRGVGKRLMTELLTRLQFLNDVGLGYLTLNRTSKTLSGGESQRIQIVTSLGSNLTGSLYILDEPSIGLHSRDTDRLITVLENLRTLGNTVIIVEHDEDVIRHAEHIVDIGPLAGTLGGEVIFEGSFPQLMQSAPSLTGQYLRGERQVVVPQERRTSKFWIKIDNADRNNLKYISAQFPLGCMTVVTGVSGSGKSTLIREVLYPGLQEAIEGRKPKKVSGDFNRLKGVQYIDQDPIGRSSRSNPVTFMKAFDAIRELFAAQPISRNRGYTAATFSFNVEGGRCDHCKGEGFQTIEMQFMADVVMRCENCNGARYKTDVLEAEYNGRNISQVLEMTVRQALEYFSGLPSILSGLQPLMDVGLDYIALGQPSIHLSGGEAQRLKLASFLVKGSAADPILFIFDEPTTGLHFHDISQLLRAFSMLLQNGHSLLVIEHNLDVIKCADWLLDLGPEGGEAGGDLLFQGTPEDLAQLDIGYTARYLKEKLAERAAVV